MLPQRLQWSEDDPAGFPSPELSSAQTPYGQPVDPSLSPSQLHSHPDSPLFTTDLNREPAHYPYVYDIQVALLRTRYYYIKYMVYRPFIYKALHFPAEMSQIDAEGAAECLRVSDRPIFSLLMIHFPGHRGAHASVSHARAHCAFLFCTGSIYGSVCSVLYMANLRMSRPASNGP